MKNKRVRNATLGRREQAEILVHVFTMKGKVRAKDIRSYIASTENKVNVILQVFTILVNLLHPRPSLFISGLFSFLLFLSFCFN